MDRRMSVPAENIVEIMRAFEQSKPHPKLDPASIQSLLATYIKSDAAAMKDISSVLRLQENVQSKLRLLRQRQFSNDRSVSISQPLQKFKRIFHEKIFHAGFTRIAQRR